MRVGDVEAALAAGADSVDEVKQLTRAGMGSCQGRTCLPLLMMSLRGRVAEARLPAARWPARPVAVRDLARPLPVPPEDQMGLMELDLAAWRASRDEGTADG